MGADYRPHDKAHYAGGTNDAMAQALTYYYRPNGGEPGVNIITRRTPISIAGVLRNFFCRMDVASGAGETTIFTVMVNGIATAITVTIGGAVDVVGFDIVNQAAVVPGDDVSIRVVTSALAGAAQKMWGLEVA